MAGMFEGLGPIFEKFIEAVQANTAAQNQQLQQFSRSMDGTQELGIRSSEYKNDEFAGLGYGLDTSDRARFPNGDTAAQPGATPLARASSYGANASAYSAAGGGVVQDALDKFGSGEGGGVEGGVGGALQMVTKAVKFATEGAQAGWAKGVASMPLFAGDRATEMRAGQMAQQGFEEDVAQKASTYLLGGMGDSHVAEMKRHHAQENELAFGWKDRATANTEDYFAAIAARGGRVDMRQALAVGAYEDAAELRAVKFKQEFERLRYSGDASGEQHTHINSVP